jgi:hypothetical protein
MKGITGAKNSEFCFSISKKNEFFVSGQIVLA